MRMQILVRLKPGVLDVQGKAVENGLGKLGYDSVAGVRVGRLIELDIDASDPKIARAQAEELCQKLLANPVIENYEIRSV